LESLGMAAMTQRALLLLHLLTSVGAEPTNPVGHANCPCVEWPALDTYRNSDSTLKYSPGSSTTSYPYPESYGALNCLAHDAGLDPFCNRDNPPAWCAQEWCFVDKNACSGVQSYSSSLFPLANAYYSYETCGHANLFTTWYESSTGSPLGQVIDIIEGYLWSARGLLEDEYIRLADTNEECGYSDMCPCFECYQHEGWGSTPVDIGDVGGNIKAGTEAGLKKTLSCLLRSTAQLYSKTAAKESEAGKRVGWQYFGDQLAGSTSWWPNVEFCDANYDPRLRPWYAAGSSGPKDVIIVVDVSGSMRKDGRSELAKQATMTLLDTLEWKDYANIILFNDGIYAQYSPTMVSVDSCTRSKMKEWAGNLDWANGGTNFKAAVNAAFDTIKTSVDAGHTSMCQKAILFLTDGDAEFTAADYSSAQANSQKYDVTFFTYALGSGANTEFSKTIACQNGGVFYPVPDGGDLASIMSQYYSFFAAGQEICTSSFTSFTDVIAGTTLWPACLPVYDRRSSIAHLLGVTCMDVNMLADPKELKEMDDGWDEFACKITDMTKKCQAMYLTECHREKIRLAYSAASVCGTDSSSDIQASTCQCLDRTVPCEDDDNFIDELGYFCDTWVGDDCDTASERFGYSAAGQTELGQKCLKSCGKCAFTELPCPYTEAATCQGHSFSAQSSKCRACQTSKVSGIDIEGNPMCCKSQAGNTCQENSHECDVTISSTSWARVTVSMTVGLLMLVSTRLALD